MIHFGRSASLAGEIRGSAMSDSEQRYGPTIDLQGFDMDAVGEPSRLPLLVGIALVVLAAFAGVVWLAYTQGVQRGRESVSRELTAQEFWKVRKPAEPAYTGLKIYQPQSTAEQAVNRTASAPAKPSAAGTIPLLRPTAGAAPDGSSAPKIAASAAAATRNPATVSPQPEISKAATQPNNPTRTPTTGAPQRMASRAPTELAKPAATPPMPMHPITAPESLLPSAPPPAASTPRQLPVVAKPVASAPKPAAAAARAEKSAAAPASESTSAPASASISAPVTGVVLQIGSYKSDAEARQSWQRFKSDHDSAAGYQSDVKQVDLGAKGTWYRLRMGPFPDKKTALETCRKLKADGASCLLAQ
jgi:hypothetical protein